VTQLGRITLDELAQHNTKDDCWQAYGGKVYNVTPYLKYHPGGVPQLMKAAGKDGESTCLRARGRHPPMPAQPGGAGTPGQDSTPNSEASR